MGFLPKGKGAMKCDGHKLPFGKLTWKQHMKVWKMIFVFKGLKYHPNSAVKTNIKECYRLNYNTPTFGGEEIVGKQVNS